MKKILWPGDVKSLNDSGMAPECRVVSLDEVKYCGKSRGIDAMEKGFKDFLASQGFDGVVHYSTVSVPVTFRFYESHSPEWKIGTDVYYLGKGIPIKMES